MISQNTNMVFHINLQDNTVDRMYCFPENVQTDYAVSVLLADGFLYIPPYNAADMLRMCVKEHSHK